jgi:exopolysaccharide production protein ExoQ
MPPGLATAFCFLAIATFFFLDRDKARVSVALLIPILWLSICASRTVGQWLEGRVGAEASSSELEEGSSFDASVFAGLALAGFSVLIRRRRQVVKVLRANGPLLCFFLYCAVSVCWSDFPMTAFKRWIKATGDLAMVLVVFTDPRPRAAMRRFLTWPGFVLLPLSILLIRYYPTLGRGWSEWTGEAYNVGVATGKNGLGYVCLIFGLGSFWCILSTIRRGFKEHSRRTLLANAAVLTLAFYLFHLADSATSLGCLVFGGVVMLLASRPTMRRNRVLIHSLVAFVLLLVLVALFLMPSLGLTAAVGRDSSLTGRTRIWSIVLPLAVNPVFGAGYESFWLGSASESDLGRQRAASQPGAQWLSRGLFGFRLGRTDPGRNGPDMGLPERDSGGSPGTCSRQPPVGISGRRRDLQLHRTCFPGTSSGVDHVPAGGGEPSLAAAPGV